MHLQPHGEDVVIAVGCGLECPWLGFSKVVRMPRWTCTAIAEVGSPTPLFPRRTRSGSVGHLFANDHTKSNGSVSVSVRVNDELSSGLVWCEHLYEVKAAELVLYGRALGLSHGEAEDVLQEVFMALMQRASMPEQPEHYVVRAYRNRALNHRRSLWRRLTRELESARWFEPSSGESPTERAAMHCLADLPAEQREVVVLKVWHQMTFEAIGELLSISPNTAAGRHRYGLQKLKACLKSIDHESLESESTGTGNFGATINLLETALPIAKS